MGNPILLVNRSQSGSNTPPPQTGWEWVNQSDAENTIEGNEIVLSIPGRNTGSGTNYNPSLYVRSFDDTKQFDSGIYIPGRFTFDGTILGLCLYSSVSFLTAVFGPFGSTTAGAFMRLSRGQFTNISSVPLPLTNVTQQPWDAAWTTTYFRVLPASGGTIQIQYSANNKNFQNFSVTESQASGFDKIGFFLATRGAALDPTREATLRVFSWLES